MFSKVKTIYINTEEELNALIHIINKGLLFADAFVFKTDNMFNDFLTTIGYSPTMFDEKNYIYDKAKKIHICKSIEQYIWISTMGLVARDKITDDKYINAYILQYRTISIVLDTALDLFNNEQIFNIDSYNYSLIEELTPVLYHNTVFYFEVLAKAYMFINDIPFRKIHSLKKLLQLIKETAQSNTCNNTALYHLLETNIEGLVKHTSAISDKFNEAHIKYDDNENDSTIIKFNFEELKSIQQTIDMCDDLIMDMYSQKMAHTKQNKS